MPPESKLQLTRRELLGGTLASGLALLTAKAADAAPAAGPSVTPRLTGIRRVIVDTDPGNDDALAILMTLAAPNLKVEAITVCPGNLGPHYEQQVKNALYLVDLAGQSSRVPVFAGMARPILNRPYPIATFIHGKYGLGRVEVPAVPQKVEREHAVDAIRRIVSQSPGEITLLALGGMTNIAMALLREPAVARKLQGILFVGGRYATPGLPPSYNVLVDPEAAHVVFTSGVPLTLVGADVISRDSILQDEDFAHIAAFNTKLSRFFIQSNDLRRTFEKEHRGLTGSSNPDPMAVATAINPALGRRYVRLYMQVELEGRLTRGLLVYGDNIYTGEAIPPPNVDLCVEADREAFKRMVFATLSAA